jgi:mRNA deadenylase 3'-5' endonuclease subunit Ccr4
MSFVVCSYNILASSYVQPRFYPHVAVEHLRPEWRLGALADAVEGLAAQIVCLQEVEEDSYAVLRHRLSSIGYGGLFVKKAGDRRDGCATFFDQSRFSLRGVREVIYDDAVEGQPASGNVALLLHLRDGEQTLGIANTHLKWQSLTTPDDLRIGLRQARQLVAELTPGDAWIVCGDFNARSDTSTLDTFWQAGFRDAYASRPDDFTCNSNELVKRIDYLLYRGPLGAQPRALPAIESTTPLPSLEQPSDHLAIGATFEWR